VGVCPGEARRCDQQPERQPEPEARAASAHVWGRGQL
jgi:hypothetical protein